jgi:hypothetical protein
MWVFRALEAGPIHCVRGLKSSLVIGQNDEIGPNSFTPRCELIWWYEIFIQKNAWSDMA